MTFKLTNIRTRRVIARRSLTECDERLDLDLNLRHMARSSHSEDGNFIFFQTPPSGLTGRRQKEYIESYWSLYLPNP
jgi:hypothetical protein